MIPFLSDSCRDAIAEKCCDWAEWLACRNHFALARRILHFVLDQLYGKDTSEHVHRWQFYDEDGLRMMRCERCGLKVHVETSTEHLYNERKELVERLRKIVQRISTNVADEAAKKQLLELQKELSDLVHDFE